MHPSLYACICFIKIKKQNNDGEPKGLFQVYKRIGTKTMDYSKIFALNRSHVL